jgi:Nucleotidyltransferase-like/Helix-turn-helix domain
MEDILRPLYQERASKKETLGILLIEKRKTDSPVTDDLDAILFIITSNNEVPVFVKQYEYKEQRAALYIASEQQISEWIMMGTNRRTVDWVLNGKVLFDRNEYVANLKKRLLDFPREDRVKRIGIEFAKLIRRFKEGKDFYTSNHHLDAFNHVVHALHHLARLSVLENGFYPEVTVWNQVKKIEPSIYRLYEELVGSQEEINKKLELLFLASELYVNKKVDIGSTHLLTIMSEKEEWTFNELISHQQVNPYAIDLGILLEFLIQKEIVVVHKVETKGKSLYHRHYAINKG